MKSALLYSGLCVLALTVTQAYAVGDIPVPYSEMAPCAVASVYSLAQRGQPNPMQIEASSGFSFLNSGTGGMEECLQIARAGVASAMPAHGLPIGEWSSSRMRFRQRGQVVALELVAKRPRSAALGASCSLQSTYRLPNGRTVFRPVTVSMSAEQDHLQVCLQLATRGVSDGSEVPALPAAAVLVETAFRLDDAEFSGSGEVRSVRTRP